MANPPSYLNSYATPKHFNHDAFWSNSSTFEVRRWSANRALDMDYRDTNDIHSQHQFEANESLIPNGRSEKSTLEKSVSLSPWPSETEKSKLSNGSVCRMNSSPGRQSTSAETRVSLLGNTGVGKSSIILRFVRQTFRDAYIPTIEDTYRKAIESENGTRMLQLTDTTGSEGGVLMRRLSIARSHALILVFSVTCRKSFQLIQAIFEEVMDIKLGQSVPVILVGNKCDQAIREVGRDQGLALARALQCPYLETSAREDINVTQLFYGIVQIIENRHPGLNFGYHIEPQHRKTKLSCTVM